MLWAFAATPCWITSQNDTAPKQSRIFSARKLPNLSKDSSVTKLRTQRDLEREPAIHEQRLKTKVPFFKGRGGETEHIANVENLAPQASYAASVDCGMVATRW